MGYVMRIAGSVITESVRRPEQVGHNTEASQSKSAGGVDNSSEVRTLDKVELSSRARDIQHAREVAQGAPEIREDKVAAARRALQSGNLKLQGQELADKLLRDVPQAESGSA